MLKQRYLAAISFVILCMACCPAIGTGQLPKPQSLSESLEGLSLDTLTAIGVHLPSYITSIKAQLAYQSASPLYQEITLRWTTPLNNQQSPGAALVLVKRLQHMQKSARFNDAEPNVRPILVIATTSRSEVRGLTLCADMPAAMGEVEIQLPQDGQIDKLLFLHLASGAQPELIAEASLKPAAK
jgi:hypothetical protein